MSHDGHCVCDECLGGLLSYLRMLGVKPRQAEAEDGLTDSDWKFLKEAGISWISGDRT